MEVGTEHAKENYLHFRLGAANSAARVLKPLNFKKRFCLMHFDQTLPRLESNPQIVFNGEEEAKKQLKKYRKAGITRLFIETIYQAGNYVQISKHGDLTLPAEKHCRKAALAVLNAAYDVMQETPYTGGCRTFYTPYEWKERGEKYGIEDHCQLIIVHDGGDFAHLIDYGHGNYTMVEKFSGRLKEAGYHLEQATCWYACLYLDEEQ